MQNQSSRLLEETTLIGEFFLKLASLREEQMELRSKQDHKYSDDLINQLDDFDYNLSQLNSELEEVKDSIKHSYKLEEAKELFESCINQLNKIEGFY